MSTAKPGEAGEAVRLWRGKITGAHGERPTLDALGVHVVSTVIEEHGVCWTVTLDDDVLGRLDPLWGRFVWSLSSDGDESDDLDCRDIAQ